MKVKSESEAAQRVRLFETPWTAAYQAPPSMGFSRQEYWSGLPLPSPSKPYIHTYTHIPICGKMLKLNPDGWYAEHYFITFTLFVH